MPKITEKTIKSFDKTQIYYRISKSKKPCLLFLHALGGNNTFFKKEQEYFSNKGFTTINMDLRGHGKSKTKKDISPEAFAKDIYTILKKESIKKVVIIGHSLGGMISLQFYKMFPERVKTIILIDSSYKLSLLTIRPFFLIFGSLICKILNTIAWSKNKRKPSLDFTKYKHTVQIVYESSFVIDNTTMKHCINTMRSSNLEEILGKIKVPVLIIETKQDEIFSKLSYYIMHKKIKNSRLDIIKGHHAIPILNPRVIDKEISKFVDKLS